MKFHEVTCEKYSGRRDKWEIHRPFAASSRRANRPLVASPLIDFLQLSLVSRHTRRTVTWECVFFLFYFIFLFSDKIFVINGLDEERARRSSERLFCPDKYFAVFDNARKYAAKKRETVFFPPRILPSRLLITIRSRRARNLADGHFYRLPVLFAKISTKFYRRIDSHQANIRSLHRGIVVSFSHRGDLKIVARQELTCPSISCSIVSPSLKARCWC